MSVFTDIVEEREQGRVQVGLSTASRPSLDALAREFGLSGDVSTLREIDAASARHLVRLVLERDLAYGAPLMDFDRASQLTDAFMEKFAGAHARFFTNGNLHEFHGDRLGTASASWSPMTSATFDTGVLVLGSESSGCLWVEDED
jgi:hypothetical protein